MEFEREYRNRLLEVKASFTQIGFLAYDAVWAIALGLNTSLSESHADCMSQLHLTHGHLGDVQNEDKFRSCIEPVLKEKIRQIEFDGVSVSVLCVLLLMQSDLYLAYQLLLRHYIWTACG